MKKLIFLSLILVACNKKPIEPVTEPEPVVPAANIQPTICVAHNADFAGKYITINIPLVDTIRIGVIANGCPNDGNINTYTVTGLYSNLKPILLDTVKYVFSNSYTLTTDDSKDYLSGGSGGTTFSFFEPLPNGAMELSIIAPKKTTNTIRLFRVK